MTEFKAGDLVKCIDFEHTSGKILLDHVNQTGQKIFTVESCKDGLVNLVGVDCLSLGPYTGFSSNRFKLIQEIETPKSNPFKPGDVVKQAVPFGHVLQGTVTTITHSEDKQVKIDLCNKWIPHEHFILVSPYTLIIEKAMETFL